MTASEQVDAVMAEMPGLLTRWESIFKSIEGKLDTLGVHRAHIDSLTPEERTFCNPLLPGLRVAGHLAAGHRSSPPLSPTCATARSIWPVVWTAPPTRRAYWALSRFPPR